MRGGPRRGKEEESERGFMTQAGENGEDRDEGWTRDWNHNRALLRWESQVCLRSSGSMSHLAGLC